PAVVRDPDLARSAERRAVRAAARVCHERRLPVLVTRYALSADLGEGHRSVAEVDRSFREREPGGKDPRFGPGSGSAHEPPPMGRRRKSNLGGGSDAASAAMDLTARRNGGRRLPRRLLLHAAYGAV